MLNLPTPIIIAHRGAASDAPENTLLAFELAHQQGADAVELDVKLSADGVPVVIHDATVDRTTDGNGTVADLDLVALKKLDAGEGQKIPTLDEVFESIGKKVFINVELTNYYNTRDDQLVDRVAEVVKKHNFSQRIFFSSFLPKNLKRAAQLLPQTPRGLLTQDTFAGWLLRTFFFRRGDYQALHPLMKNTSRKKIERIHAINRRVYTWPINNAAEMLRLADWGVDGIITGDTKLAVKVLRKK